METEKIIADIEWLEKLFRLPDNRSALISDENVENQEDNEINIDNLWFRLGRHNRG